MKIVPYDHSYYKELVKIWMFYGWDTPVPPDILPTCGYVALDEEDNFIASYFLYIGNDMMGILAFPVCALRNTKTVKDEAFSKILDHLKKDAVKAGCKMIFAFNKNQRITDILYDNGMSKAEENVTTFVFDLQNYGTSFISD